MKDLEKRAQEIIDDLLAEGYDYRGIAFYLCDGEALEAEGYGVPTDRVGFPATD